MDRTLPLILYWLILGFYNLTRVYGNAEVDALASLKTQLYDPKNVLQSWDTTLATPCTWFNVTCDNGNKVTGVVLDDAGLSGQLVTNLGQLTNLMYLELHGNNITGTIPDEIGNLSNLVSLDLYSNRLEGDIPDTLGKLQKLRFLRLNNNSLTGTIPMSLTTIKSLQLLDLSNNFLKGNVPNNGSFMGFTPISFNNNTGLYVIFPQAPPPPKSQSSSGTRGSSGGPGSGHGAPGLFFFVYIVLFAYCI